MLKREVILVGLTFKIAWRNIWRHKGRCLVIGIIIFIGAFLMTIGNGMISGMNHGLADNIVNRFTGDLVVVSSKQKDDNVLMDVISMDIMSGKPLKVIKNYAGVAEVLAKEEMVEKFLPAAAGEVFLLDTGVEMSTHKLLGVNIDSYQEMFPQNFRILEGRVFTPGERGMLIPQLTRVNNYHLTDIWYLPEGGEMKEENLPEGAEKKAATLEVKNDVVFMGANSSGAFVDVRAPLSGIIEYEALNQIWGNYCLVDIETFREAHGYVTGADSKIEIPAKKRELLALSDPDGLFTDDDFLTEVAVSSEIFSFENIQKTVAREKEKYDLDAGSYSLVFVKLKKGINQKQALSHLNGLLAKLRARAIPWQAAVGTIGNMALLVKGALNLFIMFIFFVAVIMMMNTLSMSAIERTTEIAMMRTIGARKKFAKRMFVSETGVLAFFFGVLGIVVGVIVIHLLRAINITTENEILQLVYGGNRLQPLFTSVDLLVGIVELSVVTFLSVLYPLGIVGKIVPGDAMTRE